MVTRTVFAAVRTLIPSPPPPRKINYTIADLVVKTAGTIAMKTEHVHFRDARYKYDRLGRITLECRTTTRIPGENQRIHKMQYFSRDPHYSGKLSRCKTIMCSCDCGYFKFFCEYAFWSKGISEIRYSNGAYPLSTNPRRKVFLCKHLLRSGIIIISKRL